MRNTRSRPETRSGDHTHTGRRFTPAFGRLTRATVLGLIAALAVPADAFAVTDDTEIFVNPYAKAPNRPNVLFILDTSGSMSATVAGTGRTRLQNLQDAMAILMAPESGLRDKLNAGLMHFDGKTYNQPIYYPIASLDAAANSVEAAQPATHNVNGNSVTYQVADRITDIVNGFSPGGFTPIVPTLYEATRYVRGDTVDFGAAEVAGLEGNDRGKHGVSHRSAVNGGTLTPSNCESASDFPNTSRCTSINGAATYNSPLTSDRGIYFNEIDLQELPATEKSGSGEDQVALLLDNTTVKPVAKPTQCVAADYVIFLTDGLPTFPQNVAEGETRDDSAFRTKVLNLTGSSAANCLDDPSGNGNRCGFELARFLHLGPAGANNPNAANLASSPITPADLATGNGKQWVILHTIGFNLGTGADGVAGTTYLRRLATAGGGRFYEATSASTLVEVLNDIFGRALVGDAASFATPRFASQAFNRIYTGDDVYVTLFKPAGASAWNGNVKKYRACTDLHPNWDPATLSCTVNDGAQTVKVGFGTILDKNNTTLLQLSGKNKGEVRDEARDFWSPANASGNGGDIQVGGAGQRLLNRLRTNGGTPNTVESANRKVFTYTGGYDVNNRTPAPAAETLLTATANSVVATNTALTDADFGGTNKATVINWIRGRADDADEDKDTVNAEVLWGLDDSMHAGAVPIQYGIAANSTVTKVFVPDNGGALRMFNGGGNCTINAQGQITNAAAAACSGDGAEEWMFIPRELLPVQAKLRLKPSFSLPTTQRVYGLDGTPLVWARDANNNGITTESGDFVRLIFGQREGGRRYYAVDVTAAANGTVAPKFLWKIDGNVDTSFSDLANSWSRPTLGRLRLNDQLVDVLIFGGGNDSNLNDKIGPSTTPIGNAVFIVRADTGELLRKIGGAATAATIGMSFPIPGNVTAFDSNGDGATDRLYFGDLGGNIWRSDLSTTGSLVNEPDTRLIANLADDNTTGAPIQLVNDNPATPSNDASTTSVYRAFYYAPEIVRISNQKYGGRFDLVIIASGHSAHPLDNTVQNAIYAIKDRNVLPWATLEAAASTATPPTTFTVPVVTRTSLVDLTKRPLQKNENGNLIVSGTRTQAGNDAVVEALKVGDGWVIDLADADSSGALVWRGEKAYSQPVVVAGKLLYTTYIPATVEEMQTNAAPNICKPAVGRGRLNARDLLTGGAVFAQWNTSDSTTTNGTRTDLLNDNDPTFIEGEGPPPSGVGLLGTASGTGYVVNVDDKTTGEQAGKGPPRGRIYWNER